MSRDSFTTAKGTQYVSSKKAAELTGFTSDYLSMLARNGRLKGEIKNRTRFIDLDSLCVYMDAYGGKKRERFFKRIAESSLRSKKAYGVFLKHGGMGVPLYNKVLFSHIKEVAEATVSTGATAKFLLTAVLVLATIFAGDAILSAHEGGLSRVVSEVSAPLQHVVASLSPTSSQEVSDYEVSDYDTTTEDTSLSTVTFVSTFAHGTHDMFIDVVETFTSSLARGTHTITDAIARTTTTTTNAVATNITTTTHAMTATLASLSTFAGELLMTTFANMRASLARTFSHTFLTEHVGKEAVAYTRTIADTVSSFSSGYFTFFTSVRDTLVAGETFVGDTLASVMYQAGESVTTAIQERNFYHHDMFASLRVGTVANVFGIGEKVTTYIDTVALRLYRFIAGIKTSPKSQGLATSATDTSSYASEHLPDELSAADASTSSTPHLSDKKDTPQKESPVILERVIERVVSTPSPIVVSHTGITHEEMETFVSQSENELRKEIAKVSTVTGDNFRTIALTQRVDKLSGVDISRANIIASTFEGSITGTVGSFSGDVSVEGAASFTGDLSVTGDVSLADVLTIDTTTGLLSVGPGVSTRGIDGTGDVYISGALDVVSGIHVRNSMTVYDDTTSMTVTPSLIIIPNAEFSDITSTGNFSVTAGETGVDTATVSGFARIGFDTIGLTTVGSSSATPLTLLTPLAQEHSLFVENGIEALGNIVVGRNLYPETDVASDIGSLSKRFNNVYATNMVVDTISTAGQAIFNFEPIDTTYGKASLLVNPTAPLANSYLLGIGVAGTPRFSIKETGDAWLRGALTIAGNSYALTGGGLAFGDGDTGFYESSDDVLRLQTAGADRVTVLTDGKVGIGTTSPGAMLEAISSSEQLRLGYDATNNVKFTVGSGGDLTVRPNGNNFSIQPQAATYPTFKLTSNRTTGIGYSFEFLAKASNANRLIAVGTADGSHVIASDRTGTGTPTPIHFRVGNDWNSASTLLALDTSGNVGIGTTNPLQKLDIASGNVRIDNTTHASEYGIIYKGSDRFIHNFNYGLNGGGVTTEGYNTFIGINAGNFSMGSTATLTSHASYNTGIGQSALAANATGFYNSAIGAYALYSNGTGYRNSAIGAYALFANTSGSNNFGLGYQAGRYLADGSTANQASNNSVFLGNDTRALVAGGSNEIVIGANAIGLGSNSVVLGNDSIVTTVLKGNVGIGTTSPAQKLDIASGNVRIDNTTHASEYGIIYKGSDRFIHNFNYGLNGGGVTTEGYNTFIGINAGNFTMGSTATSASQASYNTAVGNSALPSNTTGNLNLAFGSRSLNSNTTGSANVAIGHGSLYNNTTGSNNVAVGRYAGRYLADVSSNETSNNSLFFGNETRALAAGGSNEIVIGASAIGLGSNSVVLGNSSITTTALRGNVGVGVDSPLAKLHLNGGTGALSTGLAFGDGDTGFYEASDDVLRLQTAGADRVTVLADGKVGIGTTGPNAKLEVSGSILASASGAQVTVGSSNKLQFTGDYAGSGDIPAGVYGGSSNGGYSLISGAASPGTNKLGGYYFSTGTGWLSSFEVANVASGYSNLLLMKGGGNVGIGTTSPAQKLDIASGNVRIDNTTHASEYGIIYKGSDRFIHNFNYGLNGGGITTEGGNTFIGINAGNFSMGSTATLTAHASYNTGIGQSALTSNTTGFQNSAIGSYALQNNTTGYNNSAIGREALRSNTTGYQNSAIGANAGRYLANGSTANQTSNNSLFLGYDTRASVAGGSNEIVIGASAIGLGSNTVVLGNDSIVTTVLKGNVGIGTIAPDRRLDVLDATNPQLRLTYTGGSVYTDFQTNSGGDLVITPSGGDARIAGTFGIQSGSYATIFQAGAQSANITYTLPTTSANGVLRNSGGTLSWDTASYPTGTGAAGHIPYWSSSSALTYDADGFFWDATNNYLGLGDMTPDSVLDILSATASNTQLSIGNTNAGNYDPQIGFQLVDGTTNIFTMGVDDSDSDKFKISGGSALGTNDRLVIDSSGNVGIGTTSPSAFLHVLGTTEQFRLGYDASNYLSMVVSSGGMVTLDATGTSSGFTFSDAVTVNGTISTGGNYVMRTSYGTSAPAFSNDGEFGIARVSASNRIYYQSNGNRYFIWNDGAGDLSEFFDNEEGEPFDFGEVVCLSSERDDAVKRCDASSDAFVIGVVSETGSRWNDNEEGTKYDSPEQYVNVGLLGHVPTKVSLENGPIRRGDYITSSSQAGVAMKAIGPGQVIGRALDAYDGESGEVGKIMVMVQSVWWGGNTADAGRDIKHIEELIEDPQEALETLLSTNIYRFHYKEGMGTGDTITEYMGVMGDESPWATQYNGSMTNPTNTLGYMVLGFQAINERFNNFVDEPVVKEEGKTLIGRLLERINTWLSDAGNGIASITAKVFKSERVETKELCLEDVCVTKEQLRTLLEQRGMNTGNGGTTDAPAVEQLPPVTETVAPTQDVLPILDATQEVSIVPDVVVEVPANPEISVPAEQPVQGEVPVLESI
ncbi:MAG: hypothetical protein HGB03_03710 [Candidatus Yonathbacteria bacterium]|nr:hypothetical protein [Candidatus Yonathbacteria bacterium]NTW47662.1 hypothetical protein [Candidatus Yonathbacteria bacterium]